jgi:hypothetical protein
LNIEKKLYKLIAFHLLLGFLAYYVPGIFLIYPFIVIIYGVMTVVKNDNKNHEALYFAAYFVGIECFLRMTQNLFFYETGKYSVCLFMVLGMLYKKFSDKSAIFIVLIIFFLPGIIIALPSFGEDAEVRKAVVFNILGPLTLLITSLYCYDRKINFTHLKNILYSLILPLFSTIVFILLFVPKDLKLDMIGTESNYRTSGGYGPNQVSTILGLGSFAFFALFLFFSKQKFLKMVFILLSMFFAYRALLTFSRGGLITCIVMIISLLIVTFSKINTAGKLKIQLIAVFLVAAAIGIFSFTVLQTGGLISNRYEGKNAAGIEKTDKLSGRGELAEVEYQLFLQNPVFGVGIGRGRVAKAELLGHDAASHNEVTRLIAEQGVFGLLIMLFLFCIPLVHFFWNRDQLFLLPFFLFWFFTINHAAIRIAAPAFIYGLSLLKVNYNER